MAAVMALRPGTPVIVDPKSRDFSRYRGATTVTPNLHELELAAQQTLDPADTAAIAAAARPLPIAAAELEAMVVTLSRSRDARDSGAGPRDRHPGDPTRSV